MKGRSVFNLNEINELKQLINKKNSLPYDQQKAIRDQMRNIGFYITDFSPKRGFECSDLDLLIENGVIIIHDSAFHQPEPTRQQRMTPSAEVERKIQFDCDFLERHKFVDYIKYQEYKIDPNIIKKIPNEKGVYIVASSTLQCEFLQTGTGGRFKDKDPNVSRNTLLSNWVMDTNILYIGKAGGIAENGTESNSTLRKRLYTYFRFGQGEPVGHWGGRFIWQLKDSDNLMFYWRTCKNENPIDLEHKLIAEFKLQHGKRPFANLKD